MKIIEQVEKSQKYAYICYLIDCIKDISTLERFLKSSGCEIGINVVKNDTKPKHIEIGKRGEIRVQISPKDKYTNTAKCAIIKKEDLVISNKMEKSESTIQTEATNDALENKETASNAEDTQKEDGAVVDTTTVEGKEEKNETTSTEIVKVEEKEKKGEWGCEYLDEDFIKDIMSIPTVSKEEYRMVSYIVFWARRNNIDYEFDTYGNIYLTKGTLEEGEFYPCVTSHLDTVQNQQRVYAQTASPLQLKTRISKGKHELYVDGMGIGADDKAGVLISLSLFKFVDKLKACFFLEEEIGMNGSKALNKDWFNNVGYVIGWDSPDLNRAAWASSGTTLFSKEFFENEIRDVCKEWGLTSFRSEPFTDVCQIREKTDIICMNFGNGGYQAHSSTEYCVIEDMEHATGMGVALLKKLGTREFKLKNASEWIRNTNGTYTKSSKDVNAEYFRSLEYPTTYRHTTYNTHCGYWDDDEWDNAYSAHTSSAQAKPTTTTPPSTTTTKKDEKNDGKVDGETVKYIIEQYDEHIDDIKLKLKEKCDELGVDFTNFEEIFNLKIEF